MVFFSGPTGGVNRTSAGPVSRSIVSLKLGALLPVATSKYSRLSVREVEADAEAPVDVRVGVFAELHGGAAETEAQARIAGARALELARLHAVAGEEIVQRVVRAERGDAGLVQQDQVVERVAHAVAVGIRILDRAAEARHAKARRADAHRHAVGVEAGDEVEALALLALVRVARARGDAQPIGDREHHVRVSGLRFADRQALVEFQVREVGRVVERDAEEHALLFLELVQADCPGEPLGVVGRGEAQLMRAALRSRVPDQRAVVAVVALGDEFVGQRAVRIGQVAADHLLALVAVEVDVAAAGRQAVACSAGRGSRRCTAR